MEYCKRCVYPANSKPLIILDDEGVCSGCRNVESRKSYHDYQVDWIEKGKEFEELVKKYKEIARKNNNPYDCVIGVGGGKDSSYQAYIAKIKYGMNPLLASYNHTFNTNRGLRNLRNLAEQFSCDLLRFSANRDSIRKICKFMS